MKNNSTKIADIIGSFLEELQEKTGADGDTFVIACRLAIRRAIAREENKVIDEDDNKESGG